MSKWYWIAVSLFILMMLTYCSRKPSVILNDTSCKAPCWHNIEFGKADIDQAINLLSQVPELKSQLNQKREKLSNVG